ncbi:MAG: type II/IV secretion system protein [Planctomycetes bacterium]|nr:type II/IV secretion system protein [Planctomycetota bacterium]
MTGAMTDIAKERVLPSEIENEIQRLLRAGDHGIGQLVDVLLRQSVWNKVSDAHFEPFYGGLRVRFRLDGIFQDVVRFPNRVHEQIIARIKVLANLIPHKRDIAQEGRISQSVGGQDIDFRVSVVPTVGGERAVIRIFDPMRALFSIDDLGFPADVKSRFTQLLMDLDGIVILTGPSSSGKTTTMYAGLQHIYQEKGDHASIVTIEDPVEYELGMFSQIEVNRRVGMDFSATLSALLRQDPEVIMVGEIRDFETCQIALRASLTGHLILTTIHSGHACEVITRLLDMGMEPFVVSSSVKGVMAVRLIRKICVECRAPHQPDPRHLEYFSAYRDLSGVAFSRGKGCTACHQSGYLGRTSICELLVMNEELRSLVLKRSTTSAVVEKARALGMKNLLDCALDRVADGTTTLEEIRRVLGTSTGKANGRPVS